MLTASKDLENRRPVWRALSLLFLDTEMSSSTIQMIATALAESAYTEAELHSILEREVAPVLSSNLSSVAGVWDEFDQEYLESEILKRDRRWLRLWQLSSPIRLVKEEWAMIREELRAIRKGI